MYKAKNVSDLQKQLESCISKAADWFKANKLTLNVDKTKFMMFCTNTTLNKFHDVQLPFNNNRIERVD